MLDVLGRVLVCVAACLSCFCVMGLLEDVVRSRNDCGFFDLFMVLFYGIGLGL